MRLCCNTIGIVRISEEDRAPLPRLLRLLIAQVHVGVALVVALTFAWSVNSLGCSTCSALPPCCVAHQTHSPGSELEPSSVLEVHDAPADSVTPQTSEHLNMQTRRLLTQPRGS